VQRFRLPALTDDSDKELSMRIRVFDRATDMNENIYVLARVEGRKLKSTVRISLPFKDQVAANAVRKRLRDLSHKIGPTFQPVFVSKKLGQDLRPKEIKPSIVNKQCVVYNFSCDLCDAPLAKNERFTHSPIRG